MELLQLKYFCMAAQTENLSQAARYFSIPQPDMSKTISRLEEELGAPLFQRYGNRLSLNDSGRAFLHKAQAALQALEDGVLSVKDSAGELTGEIHLLVLEQRQNVTDCIVQFKERHPLVKFSIYHGFYEDTARREDLRISSLPPKIESVGSEVLLEEPIVLAVSRQHRLAAQGSVSISELGEERFIVVPNSIYEITRMLCHKSGFEPQIAILCDDPYYVRKYISIGLGISLVPSKTWQGLLGENIVLVPLQGDGYLRTTSVYWNKDRYMTSSVLAFKDLLVESIRKLS